jgi:hypothetical protein
MFTGEGLDLSIAQLPAFMFAEQPLLQLRRHSLPIPGP